MKKLVFILLLLLCLTGCNNKVEIDFNEDIKTKVSLSFTLDEYKEQLDEPNLDDAEAKSRIESIIDFRNAFTDPYSDLFEEKSFMNKGKYYEGVYEYTYTYSNFNNNSVLNNCFEYFGVQDDEDSYYILAKGESKCAPFKLIVKADNRMLSSNENSKDDDQYIWNVQAANNDIYMAISKSTIIKTTIPNTKTETSLFSVMDLIYLVIALIISIVAFILNKKFKESN